MMVTTIQITDADSLMAVADMMEELGCFAMTADELAAHAAEIARHEAEAAEDGDDDDPFEGGPAALPARPRMYGERMLAAALAYNRAHGIVVAFVPNASRIARRERRQRARARIAA